jgi:putative copper resistance protein D
MSMEQAIITWIHLVSAAVWVGGSLFIGAVLAPILKKMSMTLEERIQMMVKVGRRFNKIAVPSLIILVATGLYNSLSVLSNPDLLFTTSYGSFLFIKILLVITLIIVFAVHVRIIRKEVEDKIVSKEMTESQIQKLRKKIIILGEIIVILSVAILFFAALLDSGV